MKSRQSAQSHDGFQAILQAKALTSRPFVPSPGEKQANAALPQGFELSNLNLATATPVQTKMTIGAPGDRYEQEADNVAAQVVDQINTPGGGVAQRENMEEEEMQMKPLAEGIQREEMPEEEEEMQMKPLVQRSGNGATAASENLESEIERSRGGGQSLPDNIQTSMGNAFGADFSGVRVHAGSDSAHTMNESIGARAFTTGQDIFFRQGAYDPGSRGGQELLAHELTHVVQQNGTAVQQKKK